MSLAEQVNLILFRYAEQGLEVYMKETEDNRLTLPNAPSFNTESNFSVDHIIDSSLSHTRINSNQNASFIAIELDSKLRQSIQQGEEEWKIWLRQLVTGAQGSQYVAFKELFKKVLPDEYKLLKEFKDILTDRNSVRDI
jgi:hypothetical protein